MYRKCHYAFEICNRICVTLFRGLIFQKVLELSTNEIKQFSRK
jgi:hypothetical protein